MTKSSPSPPPAPDPVATANAQGTANINTAVAQGILGKVNQTTPYGSTTYQQTGSVDINGNPVPTYSENVSLSPVAQQAYDAQAGTAATLGGKAQTLAGALNPTPLDFNATNLPTISNNPQLLNDKAANAIYGEQKGFLDPQWQESEKQLNDQLVNQGIPVGSEAYTNAFKQFDNAKTQAYQAAQDSATAGGVQGGANLFNMALQGRQQGLNEQQLGQSFPISEIQSLLGGAGSLPTQPITNPTGVPVSPTDVTGAYGLAQQGNLAKYNAQVAQASSGNNAEASLLGTILSAVAIGSSRAIKEPGVAVDPDMVLDSVLRLPVERWKYKRGIADEGEHIGPYAEDMAREFGGDGKAIDIITMLGVLTASVQALAGQLSAMDRRMSQIEGR